MDHLPDAGLPAETDACILPNAPGRCNVLITTLSKILAPPFENPEPVKLRLVHLRPDGITAVGPPWHRPSHSNIQWLRTSRDTVPNLTSQSISEPASICTSTASEIWGWLPESFLARSRSTRQSSTSLCNWRTAISNCIWEEHGLFVPPSPCRLSVISLSEYSTSTSGVLLPSVVLSVPSDENKARFRGISHRLSLCLSVSSAIRSLEFVARRLFCPLTDWVWIEAIFTCLLWPVVLGVPQTRIRL